MKLLIVDDHAGVRDMIRRFAAAPDQEVRECATGAEAVRLAAEFQPDWVTMDVRMPAISGLDATRAIVTANPKVRVVIVSSYDQPELRQTAIEAGASGYILKDNLAQLKSFLVHPPRQQP